MRPATLRFPSVGNVGHLGNNKKEGILCYIEVKSNEKDLKIKTRSDGSEV